MKSNKLISVKTKINGGKQLRNFNNKQLTINNYFTIEIKIF